MRQDLYRACVALLDASMYDVQQRPRAWRALDALRLSAEEIAEVNRRLDVDATGDDRRARMWSAWSASVLLARRLTDASNEVTSEPLCGLSPPLRRDGARGLLRVVRLAKREEDT